MVLVRVTVRDVLVPFFSSFFHGSVFNEPNREDCRPKPAEIVARTWSSFSPNRSTFGSNRSTFAGGRGSTPPHSASSVSFRYAPTSREVSRFSPKSPGSVSNSPFSVNNSFGSVYNFLGSVYFDRTVEQKKRYQDLTKPYLFTGSARI